MKKISSSIRNHLLIVCLFPVLLSAILGAMFTYEKQFERTYEWLMNQNKIYESVLDRYFAERVSDINTLEANIPLVSELENFRAKDLGYAEGGHYQYLTSFMANYDYKSLLILNGNKERIFYQYDYDRHDKEAFVKHAQLFANRIDSSDRNQVQFDYFRFNNRLFGVVAKKAKMSNGKHYYFFLTVNNEHLNDILNSSSVYVDGAISYLVNKNSSGDYFFLTDVMQDHQAYKYGDKPDKIPLYWKHANGDFDEDRFIYNDLTGDKVLIAYSLVTELDEEFILITKVQSKFVLKFLVQGSYYIVISIIIAIVVIFYYSQAFKRLSEKNMTRIMSFCSDLISGNHQKDLVLSNFYETNAIKESLLSVSSHLKEDSLRKEYEIQLETNLRPSKNQNEFASKAIALINNVYNIDFGAFYSKVDDEFVLLSQYFSSMDESVSSKSGIMAHAYDLNQVVQVEGTLFNKKLPLEGAYADIGSLALQPKNYVFVPIIASKEESNTESLCSGMLVIGLNSKLDAADLDFLDKVRVNLALIMSFVAQKEHIECLFEQTKNRENELAAVNKELTYISRNDALTSIYNRFYGESLLELALDNKQNTLPLSVLMFDVDHFKMYNDTYGHVAGDLCLQKVAQCMIDMGFRNDDFYFRYGGEEFVVVLPNTPEKSATTVAERLRKAVQEMGIPHESSLTADSVTISIGVYTLTAEEPSINSVAELIEKVDKNLYLAKKQRNSVSNGNSLVHEGSVA